MKAFVQPGRVALGAVHRYVADEGDPSMRHP